MVRGWVYMSCKPTFHFLMFIYEFEYTGYLDQYLVNRGYR